MKRRRICRQSATLLRTGALLTSALALALAVAPSGPAAAQSNEELLRRIEQLEKIVTDQAGEIEQMKKDQDGMAKEQTGTVRSGRPGRIDVVVSGQVNRGILYADDGFSEEFFHVDNDASSTRFRILGTGQYDEKFSVGTVFEVQIEPNSSGGGGAGISQFADDTGLVGFTQRKLEIYFDHKDFGRIWLGHGDTASNGVSEQDLSGTAVAAHYSDNDTQAGGIFFSEDLSAANSAGGSSALVATNPTIAGQFTNLDGFSRDDRIRYDTPKVAGTQLRVGANEEDEWDIGLFHASKVGDFKIAGAIAYFHQDHSATPTTVAGDFGFDAVAGSVSVLHDPTGLNVTVAAGNQSFQDDGSRVIAGVAAPGPNVTDAEDAHFYYFKAGWRKDVIGIGDTAIAFDFYEGNNVGANGDWSRSYGGAIVQNVNKIATELYLSARYYSINREARQFAGGLSAGDRKEYEGIFALLMGARVKF